jgi:hypothetical protein
MFPLRRAAAAWYGVGEHGSIAMDPVPPFPEIEQRLIDFLQRAVAEGSTEIGAAKSAAFVFLEDCVFSARALQIRVPLPEKNARVAARLTQSPAAQRIGVEVRVLGTLDEVAYCTLYVPESAEDAGDHAIKGLKLAVPTKVAPLRLVTSALVWGFTRFFGKPATTLHFIMTPLHVTRILAGSCQSSGDPD